jgi:DNA-binding IclR family transcriptional regulator
MSEPINILPHLRAGHEYTARELSRQMNIPVSTVRAELLTAYRGGVRGPRA